ncbi:MAG: methyltransferase, FkbM family [Methanobacterium sp. Maddingley MBC34]|nr:MAG: methyltransferase, FkbM family [Methanobacterium sp. Maddingley MBC34]
MKFSLVPLKGQIGRFFNKILPEDMVAPILHGKLKGKKWYVRSLNIECALGTYEKALRSIFEQELNVGSVVFDIGSNVGFYSLLSSTIVGDEGHVVAFEPLLRNLYYLKKHLEMNNCDNAEFIAAAVSDDCGTSFFEDVSVAMSHITDIAGENTIKVKTVRIDNLVEMKRIPAPDFMKIDVEGAEFLVLKGSENTIKKYKPKIFLETHSDELREDCYNFLKNAGYRVEYVEMEGKNKKQIYAYVV